MSDIEIERDGPSYTVDTLAALHEREPDTELFLIVGGDMAAGFTRWREPERVLSLATLAVAKRRGTARAAVEEALAGLSGGERARFFQMPEIGVSSTEIRRRVRSGTADPLPRARCRSLATSTTTTYTEVGSLSMTPEETAVAIAELASGPQGARHRPAGPARR